MDACGAVPGDERLRNRTMPFGGEETPIQTEETTETMSDGGDPDTDGGDHGDDTPARTLAWGGPAADAGWTPCSLILHGADRSLRTLAYIAYRIG